jgi:superfamily I DNA and/or RNA helicase
MMTEKNMAIEYFDELFEIHSTENTIEVKYTRFRILLEKITKSITQKEPLQFSNLFSRLSFVCEKLNLPKKIHGVRISSNKVLHETYKPKLSEYETHLKYLSEFISKAFNIIAPNELQRTYPSTEYKAQILNSTKTRIDRLRVEIVNVHSDKLSCISDDSQTDEYLTVKFDNLQAFTSIKDFWKGAQLYLVNIEIDDSENYSPKFIILEPDYLVDISSIAECFQDFGKTELFYIKSKFEEIPNSKHIRLGNFANLVVDELFAENGNQQVSFNNTIKKDFQSYPFEYTTCTDLDSDTKFKEYLANAQLQFENIKRVVGNDFIKNDVSIENSTLEPAFLCELYGIQGRLDILELSSSGKHQKIIELKSGGVPFPDDGLSIKPNHSTQLYLYYQLIALLKNIAFSDIRTKIDGYILYSKIAENNLRLGSDFLFLKVVQDIFNLRNKIIINEYYLTLDDLSITKEIICKITPENLINGLNVNPNFRQRFLEPQINEVVQPIIQMDEIEQNYFYSFVSFIAKEQYLAKIGDSDNPNQQGNGLANLWLNSFIDKKDKFEILYDLTISENLIDKEEKEITFSRTNKDNEFVNFRKGDICVLYPRNGDNDSVTTNQIFKCSIKELSKHSLVVSFRYQQRNTKYFQNFDKWALERDFMDSSFRAMYKNLYAFISSKEKFKRQLVLTTENPIEGSTVDYHNENFSEEQNRIIKKALSAKNYFLLNGPPGTGKTSIIIKELVRELYRNKDANILLLAYTNRAVDEICEAVNNAIINFDDINDGKVNFGRTDRNFIRIGNELSCSQKHKHNLLSNISKNVSSRNGLKELLNKHRIYISTVASMASKMDIFKLKKFDTIIVDEASQILEPQIIGLLPKCEKFILIGDHKQLPAIVLQSEDSSKTKSKELENIGLHSRKNSLFERLYTFCENNKLEFAFDKLTYQGRMHKEIALFPSHSFYESKLKQAFDIPNIKPEIKEELKRQDIPLSFTSKTKNTLEDLLAKKRLIFFSSKRDLKDSSFGKKNNSEAELVVKIITEIKTLYESNSMPFDNSKTIGVIAPFRNQIALIKQKLEEAQIPNYENITVDTVERYQGSQRDIIILSFAINNPYQLNGVINTNDDGTVDRKLNVALTRAKEQLILIGNDSILSNNLIYYKLIEFVKSKGGYIYDTIQEVIEGRLRFNYFDSDETIEGKTYSPDGEFKATFDDLIIDVLKNDDRTSDYPKLLLGETNDFIRNNVIEYGRTDFDSISLFAPDISVEDKVNLYCFYNMRKHYFSSFSIYESYSGFFNQELNQSSGRISFFDFGCGPLTSGLAFNQLFKNSTKFNLKYFGIDISKTMLSKAKEFSKTSLFNHSSQFNFIKSIKEISNDILEENFRLSNTVILNFSYLFANLSIEQTISLANDINKLVSDFPLNKYIIIYQNPKSRHHNFTKFKRSLNNFENSIARKTETVSYKNQHQSWYDKTEVFTYEILTN